MLLHFILLVNDNVTHRQPTRSLRKPPTVHFPSHRYSAARKTLYCTFMNTVFATALRPSIIITCVAGLWAWGVYAFRSMVSDETLAFIDSGDDSTGSTTITFSSNSSTEENIAYFLQNLDRMAGLTALVQGYMSFMLVFFALQSLVLWSRTYAEMRSLAVQLENLGLFFSNFTMERVSSSSSSSSSTNTTKASTGNLDEVTVMPSNGDVDDDVEAKTNTAAEASKSIVTTTRKAKWTMYRYLNLLHFFLYAANVSSSNSTRSILSRSSASRTFTKLLPQVEFLLSDFKNILTRQLVRVGLLEQREKEIIDDSQFPIATINSWISNLIWDRGQFLAPRLGTSQCRLSFVVVVVVIIITITFSTLATLIPLPRVCYVQPDCAYSRCCPKSTAVPPT